MELFVAGSLDQLVPEDHVLARVDRVLDLGWLREEVADCYCVDNGRPGIDPEVAVRLMLAGLLLGIVHDRRLMREAQVNIAIRWFIGYGLHERRPDHSSLTRIRQRWGEAWFREIFQRTVAACLDAKIATAEVVHVDASLIRADASWERLVERHTADVMTANPIDREIESGGKRSRGRGKSGKVSRTDPDASMATAAENRQLEPYYKQHTAVDDARGVVLDVLVTTGAVSERETIEAQVDEVRAIAGREIETVTANAGYAYARDGGLERRGIDPVIPVRKDPSRSRVPLRRFRYDARNDILKCPRGKILRLLRVTGRGRFFSSRTSDCTRCPLKGDCPPKTRIN